MYVFMYGLERPLLVVFMQKMVSELCGWQDFYTAVDAKRSLEQGHYKNTQCERQTGHSAYLKTRGM